MEFFSFSSGGCTERGQRKMNKAEYKRTKKKLKEKVGVVPVVKMKKKKRGWGQLPHESLTDQRKAKVSENEHDVVFIGNEARKDREIIVTNGIELPNWVVLIKQVTDVKVAKRIARMANSWYRKLYGLEETRLVKEFQPGDDVWWTKKGLVNTGRVVRLKSRKLVIDAEPWDPNEERVVLPVRKVKKGPVPKEYLVPDGKRWAIGRKAA